MDDNDNTKDTLIKLETLQKEYEVTLQQYQEGIKNYITTLQSGTESTTNTFSALKGRSWWGTQGLTEGGVQTQDECQAMCANTTNCSGATFNPDKHYCWARGGHGSLTPGLDNDYALIPAQKAALIVMQSLNDRLLTLADQIANEMKMMQPVVEEQMKEKNMNQTKLNISYQHLLKQKMEMEPNPCWEGYEPYGLKDDGSPNCVPIKEEQSKQKFVIPSPEGGEDEQKYISRCISEIIGEYDQEGQSYAICKAEWDK
jgi:hypothetical protein